jgi:hypothetical protein
VPALRRRAGGAERHRTGNNAGRSFSRSAPAGRAWRRVAAPGAHRSRIAADGTSIAQGKIWPRDQPEPTAWTIEKIDRIPQRAGAPGLYGDGIADVLFDNFKVYKNQ